MKRHPSGRQTQALIKLSLFNPFCSFSVCSTGELFFLSLESLLLDKLIELLEVEGVVLISSDIVNDFFDFLFAHVVL